MAPAMLVTVLYRPRVAFAALRHGPRWIAFLPALVLTAGTSTLALHGARFDEPLGFLGSALAVVVLVALPAVAWLQSPVINTLALEPIRRRAGNRTANLVTLLAAFALGSLPVYIEAVFVVSGLLPGLGASRLLPATSPRTIQFCLARTLDGLTPGFLWTVGLGRVALTEMLQLTPRRAAYIVAGLAALDLLVQGLEDWLFSTWLRAFLQQSGVG